MSSDGAENKIKRKDLVNHPDQDGMTLAVNAIMTGNIVPLGLLLLSGADPNALDSLNCSVLEHACLKADPRAVALLLRMGANFEGINTHLGTPLKDLANNVVTDVLMYLPKNKLEAPSGDGDEKDGGGKDSDNEMDFDSKPLTFDNFPMDIMEDGMDMEYGLGRKAPKSRMSTSSGDIDMAALDPEKASAPLSEELVPLDGPLADVHAQLQNACCTGDVETITSILRLPPVPYWLRQLHRVGGQAQLKLRNSKIAPAQAPAPAPTPSSTIAPPPHSASSSSSTVHEKEPVLPSPKASPLVNRTSSSDLKRKPTKTSSGTFASKTKKSSAMSVDTNDSSELQHSDDDVYYDDDDDDDGNDYSGREIKPGANGNKASVTFGEDDLDQMILEQCNELGIFFESLTPSDAEMVLRFFKWALDLERIGSLMDKGYDENKFREVAGLPMLSRPTPPPQPQDGDVCAICTTSQPAEEFISLGCVHNNICKTCWQTYLSSRAESGLAMELLASPCIGHTKYSPCNLVVPMAFVMQHGTPETKKMYQKKRYEEFVMNNKKRVMAFCPGPDCGRVCAADPGIKVADVIRRCVQVTCQCDMSTFCMGCIKLGNEHLKGQPHAPATCRNVQAWVRKTTEEGRFFTFRAKHCPNCRILIMKCGCQTKVICNDMDHCPNQACNHMHCKKCDTHFCWMCGNLWADHNNYYNCNKELSKELTPVEFFKGCLERYDDHMKNHKLTRSRAVYSSDMYEFFRLKLPALVQNDIFTESNSVMSECFSVLAYSYVRRHYIVFAHEAERNLYEMQQGMLENHTNQLLEMYQEFKRIYESMVVETTASNIEKMRKDLVKMREFTKLLHGFRRNLVESFSASDVKDEEVKPIESATAETSG